jgi:hypothetical protein
MKNKAARKALESRYGKGCMFTKAHCEERIEALRTIKTFKMYKEEKRYTGRKIKELAKQMTYHHLKHRSEGGKTNLDNGSVVNGLAHAYMHSLPREHEEIVNNMIREYKMGIAIIGNGEVTQTQSLELDFNIDLDDCITIPLEKDNARYNRARVKRETQRMIDEELEL